MSLYLVRYGELWLKSPNVKKRFQRRLARNIEDAFLRRETQCLTSMDWGRIYIHTPADEVAEDILKRTFGVTSFSRVMECTSKIQEICKCSVDLASELLNENSSFAVRAKRTGSHKYTSQDAAREVGSAILEANPDLNLKVDLSNPDTEIFIEIRHDRGFAFSEKIQGPGGFPFGSQGKILALVTDKKSVYAAWLIMKRGCNIRILAVNQKTAQFTDCLRAWGYRSKPHIIEDHDKSWDEILQLNQKYKTEALVVGYTFNEFEKSERSVISLPIFYPLIGMDKMEIDKGITSLFDDGS